jgi:MFS transporter, SP family, solute carrier family 2 (myo-inositol transporter), member 13
MPIRQPNSSLYGNIVLFVAGMGGLLYGVDVGIISAALLYLGKTVNLTLGQESLIVAAVLGGSMFSSLVAGLLADWLGRKPMVIISGLLFVLSVILIVISQGFVSLFLGRLLQGLSGGVIAVVVPLYLAESLNAKKRGQGTGIFQLMLTIGIALAALSGWFYTHQADAAITAAAGNPALIRAAEEHAWRGMFLSVIYPGVIFFLGGFLLSESPRWLFLRGRLDDARGALRLTSSEQETDTQLKEMAALDRRTNGNRSSGTADSLLQRKYIVPFVLACVILTCNQTTGINSVLAYLATILRHAGLDPQHATQGDFVVKLLNVVMTVVAIALVDRRGRKFLLVLGTSGVIIALTAAALISRGYESKQTDIRDQLSTLVHNNELTLRSCSGLSSSATNQPMALSVLYSYGRGDKIATAVCSDQPFNFHIAPKESTSAQQLIIKHAFYGPMPTQRTGWLIVACMALFIASFSVGPGVVVWLALSELMPTRIRSAGMGLALLLNQGTSTLIAGVFLPVVGNHGYSPMFAFWAGCTVIYLITALFFLPETKGKTLEEIQMIFDRRSSVVTQ